MGPYLMPEDKLITLAQLCGCVALVILIAICVSGIPEGDRTNVAAPAASQNVPIVPTHREI